MRSEPRSPQLFLSPSFPISYVALNKVVVYQSKISRAFGKVLCMNQLMSQNDSRIRSLILYRTGSSNTAIGIGGSCRYIHIDVGIKKHYYIRCLTRKSGLLISWNRASIIRIRCHYNICSLTRIYKPTDQRSARSVASNAIG